MGFNSGFKGLIVYILCFCTVHCNIIRTQTQIMHNFFKLIFNFCCLLHVSNFVCSSSGKQLYMQYGMFYKHKCEQSGGEDSLPRAHRPLEICRRILEINSENCAFRWFVLYCYVHVKQWLFVRTLSGGCQVHYMNCLLTLR